nr:uncharacterized protein LOC123772751 [Procambarus clarkii]
MTKPSPKWKGNNVGTYTVNPSKPVVNVPPKITTTGSLNTSIIQQLADQLKLKPLCQMKLGGYTSPVKAIVVDKIPFDLYVYGLGNTTKLLKRNGMKLADYKINSDRLNDVGTYAYTADISKVFLRVGLQEEDRNFTKFLWIKHPNDPRSEIITYRFASDLFGATSSLFLLQATFDTHLKKLESPHKIEISNNLYVDNFQGTTNDKSKLI